ncbi:hypothetical protein AAMO2058_001412800 [Amorphochlora amoebiformis]|uniref:Uncharacterized protein n=2 Tax=Amorphochlora amoebiformis TaxID=1561963 RepID=A0A7S0CVT2_9EUKA|mmetsp:Transcript_14664/g.23224  ORF Transcript_14664/g.23224 Transcript_14664/m.23224 type:complete len:234 (+) Transcript_14664:61-762(+)
MESAIKALEIEDEDTGETLAIKSFAELKGDRVERYRRAFPECKEGTLVAVNTGDVEHIAVFHEGKAKVVLAECGITLSDLSPTQLVEYTYDEKGPWLVSKCSLTALESYRKMKFSQWKKALTHPNCMASFRRVLQMGLVTDLFDHVAFPEATEGEKKKWQVKNEQGKIIHIPHPVYGLRIWNKSKNAYDQVRTHMEGAPKPEDSKAYWEQLLNELRQTRGTKLIDDILAQKLS